MTLRRRLISKLFAVWFVVLIVLPFTAPFQVWGADAPIGKCQGDGFKTSDTSSKDVAVASFAHSQAALAVAITLRVRPSRGRPGHSPTLGTILRL